MCEETQKVRMKKQRKKTKIIEKKLKTQGK